MALESTYPGAGDQSSTLTQAHQQLREGNTAEAFTLFQGAAQAAPNAPEPLLGLAETYLAMGNLPQVAATAEQVRGLAPDQPAALLAQALFLTAAGDYAGALAADDAYIARIPGQPYAYALRGHLLRRVGQRYEGELAKARAARGWGTRDFDHLFPPEPPSAPTPNTPSPGGVRLPQGETYNSPRPWSERSQMQRQMTRIRFVTRGRNTATYALMAANIAVYLLCALFSVNLFNPLANPNNPIYNFGIEQGQLIAQQPWQVYRILTAMFLHESIIHIGLNMLSLYFVGVITEQFFGTRRFLIIYFASGILAGAAQAILTPLAPSLGASGAIFGIFGAFGAFAFLRRREFGRAGNSILMQWFFWLALNLVIDFQTPNIATWAHISGLLAGIIIGAFMLQAQPPRRTLPGR